MYILNSPGNPIWAGWPTLSEQQKMPDEIRISELMVNTGETFKQAFFMDRLLRSGDMVLFVGPSGPGKTLFMNNYMSRLAKEKFSINFMNFAVKTTATKVQEKILDKMVK